MYICILLLLSNCSAVTWQFSSFGMLALDLAMYFQGGFFRHISGHSLLAINISLTGSRNCQSLKPLRDQVKCNCPYFAHVMVDWRFGLELSPHHTWPWVYRKCGDQIRVWWLCWHGFQFACRKRFNLWADLAECAHSREWAWKQSDGKAKFRRRSIAFLSKCHPCSSLAA